MSNLTVTMQLDSAGSSLHDACMSLVSECDHVRRKLFILKLRCEFGNASVLRTLVTLSIGEADSL